MLYIKKYWNCQNKSFKTGFVVYMSDSKCVKSRIMQELKKKCIYYKFTALVII